MWSHTQSHHNNVIGPDRGRRDYAFHVISSFKDSFSRIVDESVRLSRENRDLEKTGGNSPYFSLNGKGEYFVNKEVREEFFQL